MQFQPGVSPQHTPPPQAGRQPTSGSLLLASLLTASVLASILLVFDTYLTFSDDTALINIADFLQRLMTGQPYIAGSVTELLYNFISLMIALPVAAVYFLAGMLLGDRQRSSAHVIRVALLASL